MAHILSELSNDVYDLNDLGPDPDFIGNDGFGFMLLGVFVTIIPKVDKCAQKWIKLAGTNFGDLYVHICYEHFLL